MDKCTECEYKKTTSNEKVSAHVVEVMTASYQYIIKRLIAIIIILVVLLVGSNVAWIIYESQFETVNEEQITKARQEAEGGDNYAVIGDLYGEADSDDS